MSERISISEFARREGCNEKQVRRALESGKLSKGKDDKLDAKLVKSGWRKTNRRTAAKGGGETTPADVRTTQDVRTAEPKRARRKIVRDETPAQAAERMVKEQPLLSLPDAIKLKENYLARRQQLEYDLKAGTVVIAADVAKAVGSEYASVRTKLLAIPSERAAELHRLKTVTEVQDALRSVIVEALQRLTLDGPPPAGSGAV